MAARVVFFDKEGTLVENVPYNADPALMRLIPGGGKATRAIHEGGWRLTVVTNQSGIARGMLPESAMVGIETRLRDLLAEFGVSLAGFFYCPHHPAGAVPSYAISCNCRKPEPGLILYAAEKLRVDPQDCWFVGDSLSDVQAGRRAGCQTILLVGEGSAPLVCEATYPAINLDAAVRRVLQAG